MSNEDLPHAGVNHTASPTLCRHVGSKARAPRPSAGANASHILLAAQKHSEKKTENPQKTKQNLHTTIHTPQCHETQQRCWWSLMALSPNKSSLQCGEKLPLPSQDHACESQRIQACPAASRYPNNILHPTSRYQPFPAHPERKNQLNASGFQSSAIHPIQVIL